MRIFLFVAAQENGAKRRAKRQGIKGGKNDRGSNGYGKLLINLSGYAGHQSNGNKYRQQNKRGGDNSAGNLLHRLD